MTKTKTRLLTLSFLSTLLMSACDSPIETTDSTQQLEEATCCELAAMPASEDEPPICCDDGSWRHWSGEETCDDNGGNGDVCALD